MVKRDQKFTPLEYTEVLLNKANYKGNWILKKYFVENSCGSGNILVEAVRRYIITALDSKISRKDIVKDLEEFFIGYEVDKNTSLICKDSLDLLALEFGLKNIKWDIRSYDYLKSKLEVKADFIIGNPPYITYQDLNILEREYLKKTFKSCFSGKFDYCYPFIEKSIDDLNSNGILCYLIPSSIFKNRFAFNLREIMKKDLSAIIDYKYRKVFGDALTSPAIMIVNKGSDGKEFEYVSVDEEKKLTIQKHALTDKWIFEEDYTKFIEKNENTHSKFGDYFSIVNSVATLLNSVFVIKNYEDLGEYIKFENIVIEKASTRVAASPRALTNRFQERIIFPYKSINGELVHYSESEFSRIYPKTYSYLKNNKSKLLKRKADGAWYEYGRTQALKHIFQSKLMISSVITNKVKVHELAEETVPYSGFFIFKKKTISLNVAKEILESQDFLKFIQYTAINANGKSIRTSVKEIEKYPIFLDEK